DRGAWGRSTGRDGAERRLAPLTMTDLVCGEIAPFPEYLRARAPARHEQLRHPFDFAQGRLCPHMICADASRDPHGYISMVFEAYDQERPNWFCYSRHSRWVGAGRGNRGGILTHPFHFHLREAGAGEEQR